MSEHQAGKDLKELIFRMKDELKILHSLNKDELEKIVPCFEIIRYPAGAVIFSEGEPGDFIGLLVSGKVEVKKQTDFHEKQIVLAILSKGSFVGELSMVDRQPRSATVVALEDSEMIILRRDALDSFMQKYPEIGVKVLKGIIQVMSIRLRKSVERLARIF
jgi:CRP/FNR family transcriptional regulator/CRP/FNR family cyclic AMP-dependent transcriptional regulator